MARTKIKISENDLKTIYGNDYRFFQDKILPNCFCGKCCVGGSKPMVAIKDYEISLNELNDIELQGFCANCGKPIGRYLETGEVKEYAAGIKKIKESYKKR